MEIINNNDTIHHFKVLITQLAISTKVNDAFKGDLCIPWMFLKKIHINRLGEMRKLFYMSIFISITKNS